MVINILFGVFLTVYFMLFIYIVTKIISFIYNDNHIDYTNYIIDTIEKESPIVANILKREVIRQENTIELIASENFVSDAVMAVNGSPFMLKYTEGYPDLDRTGSRGRYYGGCQYYDELEQYCCYVWQKAFKTDYHVNVQPHSGSSANMEMYSAFLNQGDTLLSMSMDAGSHLTHASPVSFVSKLYNVVTYGIDKNGFINYDEVRDIALKCKPKMILAGASAYPRIIDFKKFKEIADECGAYFAVDMAHIAGLVAAGCHPSPFGLADVITTTTHKTLRNSRGGIIFCKPEYAGKVDSSVFPRHQGGSLMNAIAGKAIGGEQVNTKEFVKYANNVVKNSKAMCDEFIKMGYDVVTGGTDNHMFLIDLTKLGISGKQVQDECDKHYITLNKNCVPNETRSPKEASGIRIGTPAMTSKGFTEKDFIETAHKIDAIIKSIIKDN